MNSNQLTILIILIGYLIFNVVFGILYSKKQEQNSNLSKEKNFFVGGRNINGLVLAMTTMATYTSVSSFISGPGAAGMTYGYAQAWVAAVQIPVTFFVLGVLGNKLAIVSRKTGAITVVGYLKERYKSDLLVIVISILMVVFFLSQMVAQFSGGATLISSITGLNHIPALLIFSAVVIIYTAFGGFSAVAITDTIQGIIMCIGTFLLIFFVLKSGGGLQTINENLQAKMPEVFDNLTSQYTPGALISFWVLVGFGTLGLPQTSVRAMTFKDTKSLHKAMLIGVITCSFVIVGMHLAGVWAGALLPQSASLESSDYFIPYIIQKIMPSGVAGLFLAAPMAAIMSTVDSLLILAVATIIRDLWRNYVIRDNEEKIKNYNRHVKKISACLTVILGIIVVFFTINPPDIIFFINLFAMGGLECAFFWPLIGGLFWKKGTKQAAIVSSIGATMVYLICYYKVDILGINAVVWGLAVGGILYFIVGKLTYTRELDKDILDKCF